MARIMKVTKGIEQSLKKSHTSLKKKTYIKNIKGKKSAVMYISNLPHGFYEKGLKGYFSQFGKITRLRVARSNKTARSKGYAFIEFLVPEVADIAAKTMDGFFMFNKSLKCKVIEPEDQFFKMFLGTDFDENNCPGTLKRRKHQRRLNSAKKVDKNKLKVDRASKFLAKTLGVDADALLVKEEKSPVKSAEEVTPEKLSANDSGKEIGSKLKNSPKRRQKKVKNSPISKTKTEKSPKKAESEVINQVSKVSPKNKRKRKSSKNKEGNILKVPKIEDSLAKTPKLKQSVNKTPKLKKSMTKTQKLNDSNSKKSKPSKIKVLDDIENSISKKTKSKNNKKGLKNKTPKNPISVPKIMVTAPTPKTSAKPKKLVLDIDELDDEIILKTPPNVIKNTKKGQEVTCDPDAPTVRKPLGRKRKSQNFEPSPSLLKKTLKNTVRKPRGKKKKSQILEPSPLAIKKTLKNIPVDKSAKSGSPKSDSKVNFETKKSKRTRSRRSKVKSEVPDLKKNPKVKSVAKKPGSKSETVIKSSKKDTPKGSDTKAKITKKGSDVKPKKGSSRNRKRR